jgi:predicted O-methyltransferase YrrM
MHEHLGRAFWPGFGIIVCIYPDEAAMSHKTLDEIHKQVDGVDGWLTYGEGTILYELTKQTKGKGAIVEIGSWQGKSTIYIGNAIKTLEKQPKFYAVDPHVGSEEHWDNGKKVWTYEKFEKNIKDAKVDDVVTPVVKYSYDFVKEIDESVELIFIDGAHDYDSVEKDFLDWYPKVIDGGVMAFHDTYSPGDPYQMLRKYVYPSRNFGVIRRVDSITYVTKLERNSLPVYLYNRCKRIVEDLKPRLYKHVLVKKIIESIK